MASENPHHSSLDGADSLSYSENGMGQSRSNPSGLHTYEQRVEASGMGGERYRAGPKAEHPTQTAAHKAVSAPGADGSQRTNPDGTYRSHGHTAQQEGTIAAGNPETKRPTAVRRTTSASSASSSASSDHGTRVSASTNQPHGDSKAGKLMEKVGKSIHSAKLAEKGEAKREKAAGLQ